MAPRGAGVVEVDRLRDWETNRQLGIEQGNRRHRARQQHSMTERTEADSKATWRPEDRVEGREARRQMVSKEAT